MNTHSCIHSSIYVSISMQQYLLLLNDMVAVLTATRKRRDMHAMHGHILTVSQISKQWAGEQGTQGAL